MIITTVRKSRRFVRPPVTGAATPPSVTLASSALTGTAPLSLTLTATPVQGTNPLLKVEFYQDSVLIGTRTTAPWTQAVSGLAVGLYIFTAKVYDTASVPNTGSSNGAIVTVSAAVGTPQNVALATFGSIATASSQYSALFAPAGAINGDRKGLNWGVPPGGGWNDLDAGVFPDVLTVMYAGGTPQTINRMVACFVQDNFQNPIEPTLSTVGTLYVPTDFVMQYCTDQAGTVWVTPGTGTITGNNKIVKDISFANAVAYGQRISISAVQAGGGNYSRVTEFEGWSAAAPTIPNQPPTVSISIPQANYGFPATVPISALAADGDGTISDLKWYQGGLLIHTEISPPNGPFTFNWAVPSEGDYVITVKATDNNGSITTSNVVNLHVGAAIDPNETANGQRFAVRPDGNGGWIFPIPLVDGLGNVYTFGAEDTVVHGGNFKILKNGVHVGPVVGDTDRLWGWGNEMVYAAHKIALLDTRTFWQQLDEPTSVWSALASGDPGNDLFPTTLARTGVIYQTPNALLNSGTFASGDTILMAPGPRPESHQIEFRRGSVTIKSADVTQDRKPGQVYGNQPWEIDVQVYGHLGANVRGAIFVWTLDMPAGAYRVELYNPILKAPLPAFEDASGGVYLVSDDGRPVYLYIKDGFISGFANGILGSNNAVYGTTIELDGTKFDFNGRGGNDHQFYIGQPGHLICNRVHSTRCMGAHLGKSRARKTTHTQCTFGGDINGDYGNGESAVFDFCGAGDIHLMDSEYIKSPNNEALYWWFYLGREARFTNQGSTPIDHTGYEDKFLAERCLFVNYGPLVDNFVGFNFDELNFFSTINGGPPTAWLSKTFIDCIFSGPNAQVCYDYLLQQGATLTNCRVVPLSEIVTYYENERKRYRWIGSVPSYNRGRTKHVPFFIPGTAPMNFAGIDGDGFSIGAINAFQGGQLDRPNGDMYLTTPGGHAEGRQSNGIYVARLMRDLPIIERIFPSDPHPGGLYNSNRTPQDHPCSVHSYNDIHAIYHLGNLILYKTKSTGANNNSYLYPQNEAFHLSSNAWDPVGAHPNYPGSLGFDSGGCVDWETNTIYSSDAGALRSFLYSENFWRVVTPFFNGNYETYVTGSYDSLRKRIMFSSSQNYWDGVQFDRRAFAFWDILGHFGGIIAASGAAKDVIGSDIAATTVNGFDYDPDNDCHVLYSSNTGSIVKVTPTGVCTFLGTGWPGGGGGVRSRWRYVPGAKAFLGVIQWDQDMVCMSTIDT